jgi:hypothetical protein
VSILILCIGRLKYVGIILDKKLYSHEQVYYVSSHALKFLVSHIGLITFMECVKLINSRRRNLGGLFILNVSKEKINCLCIMGNVTFLVTIKLSGDVSTLTVSSNPVPQPGVLSLPMVCVYANFLMFSEETRFPQNSISQISCTCGPLHGRSGHTRIPQLYGIHLSRKEYAIVFFFEKEKNYC